MQVMGVKFSKSFEKTADSPCLFRLHRFCGGKLSAKCKKYRENKHETAIPNYPTGQQRSHYPHEDLEKLGVEKKIFTGAISSAVEQSVYIR